MSVIDPERVAPGNPVSAGRLLLLVRRGIATTRRELIRVTGLSRSTVTQRVDALLGAGLLRESAGEAEGRGRPAGFLSFDEGFGHVLVAGVHRDRVELTAVDLGGRELHPVPVHAGDEDVPEPLVERERAGRAAAPLGLARRLPQQPGGQQRVHPLGDRGPRQPGDPDQVAPGGRDPPPHELQQPPRRHGAAGHHPVRVDHRHRTSSSAPRRVSPSRRPR
jgi:DNA-binding transcriptional ArsR family regulator